MSSLSRASVFNALIFSSDFFFSYKLCPVTGQARDTLRPALQHSALHKVRELEGKARVWDMSGGLHMSGTKRGNFFAFLKCPYLL